VSCGRVFAAATVVLVLTVSAACGGSGSHTAPDDALHDDAISVGSFNFAESELLAEIYAQALEHAGFTVERQLRVGPRELVSPALSSGLVELVPEYAGTALQFLSLGSERPSADTSATHLALLGAAAQHGLVALDPAPAQNTNEFVVTHAVAQRHGLRALSDLATTSSELTFGGPPECPTRPLCLAGLRTVYGASFRAVVALDAGGPLTHEAISEGYVDVALMFSTDPGIGREGLLALDDDLDLQPAENVTPLVHGEVVRRFGPSLVATIDDVSSRLTTEDLRGLNASIDAGDQITDVAARWLAAQGLR
jgi:osmoprotectant transport system substrate-binding protein